MERDFRFNWAALVEEAVRRRKKLGVTQKRLAEIAQVSTGTISRFEQAEKDIQLSSVLAILESLGLLDTRTLLFADPQERYDRRQDAVAFTGLDHETAVSCAVSGEALEDHFGADQRDVMKAFVKHRPDIEALVRRKYLLGQTEPDGSVLLKTDDIA
ncbi:MAG: DUF1488 family protein [Defluviicoccus sp.]|nr:MAG: DUF1488 family protein [Defluviicoccus sp.]